MLRDEPTSVEKIIRALAHLRGIHPRKKKLASSVCLASSEAPSIGRVPTLRQAQDRLFLGVPGQAPVADHAHDVGLTALNIDGVAHRLAVDGEAFVNFTMTSSRMHLVLL